MAKYRKKPIEIEAFKWTANEDQDEDPMWIVKAIQAGVVTFSRNWSNELRMDISTLEGLMSANIGDYIIQGVKGEIYPCKPDIFEMTYEICV